MHEMEPDSKWNDGPVPERDDSDLRRRTAELEAEFERLKDEQKATTPAEADNREWLFPDPPQPDESQLAIIALLMRIYDIQMAILTATHKQMADEVYEAHEKGETFNPQLFIPHFETGPLDDLRE